MDAPAPHHAQPATHPDPPVPSPNTQTTHNSVKGALPCAWDTQQKSDCNLTNFARSSSAAFAAASCIKFTQHSRSFERRHRVNGGRRQQKKKLTNCARNSRTDSSRTVCIREQHATPSAASACPIHNYEHTSSRDCDTAASTVSHAADRSSRSRDATSAMPGRATASNDTQRANSSRNDGGHDGGIAGYDAASYGVGRPLG
jgi:hypothetical protein